MSLSDRLRMKRDPRLNEAIKLITKIFEKKRYMTTAQRQRQNWSNITRYGIFNSAVRNTRSWRRHKSGSSGPAFKKKRRFYK